MPPRGRDGPGAWSRRSARRGYWVRSPLREGSSEAGLVGAAESVPDGARVCGGAEGECSPGSRRLARTGWREARAVGGVPVGASRGRRPVRREPRPAWRELWSAWRELRPAWRELWPAWRELWPAWRELWPAWREPWPAWREPWPAWRPASLTNARGESVTRRLGPARPVRGARQPSLGPKRLVNARGECIDDDQGPDSRCSGRERPAVYCVVLRGRAMTRIVDAAPIDGPGCGTLELAACEPRRGQRSHR